MQGQMSEYSAVLWRTALDNTNHVPPHDITETTKNDECGGDDIDQGIGCVIAKAVFRDNINAGITESGN